jgi:toxin ParE1/3/4
MMRLRLSPRAISDLEGIGDYIPRDNPGRASTFVEELIRICERLRANPLAYLTRNDML